MSRPQRLVLSRGFQLLLVLLPFLILSGFDHVWSGGGGNGNWSNAANWTTPTPVDAAETHPINITFPSLTPTPLPLNQDIIDVTVDSLSFDGHAYTLNGFPFQMKGPIVVGPLSIFDDHIINVSIDLAADLNATVTGPNAGLIFNGPIGGAFNVATGGQGFTVFGAANTYTGTTTIQSGTLILANPDGFGAA
ncbi:MAG TPA: hypothetical protein VGR00_01800, partial [Thermoanaerobaculia bacterium]|nr:hypothetical protein [Thermoanaerobaculia bacterium]